MEIGNLKLGLAPVRGLVDCIPPREAFCKSPLQPFPFPSAFLSVAGARVLTGIPSVSAPDHLPLFSYHSPRAACHYFSKPPAGQWIKDAPRHQMAMFLTGLRSLNSVVQ